MKGTSAVAPRSGDVLRCVECSPCCAYDSPLTLFVVVRRREFGREGGIIKFGAVYGTRVRVGNTPVVWGMLW